MSDPSTRIEQPGDGLGGDESDTGQDQEHGREQEFPPDRKEGQPGREGEPGGEPSRERPKRRPDEGQEGSKSYDL